MKLLPWHCFEIETALDINAVREQLRDETEVASFLPTRSTRLDPLAMFRGRLGESRFRISLRGPFSFSPMPEMHGLLTETENGTRIRVEMVPATWLLWIVAGAFAILSVTIFDTGLQVYAMVAAMFPFGWFLTTAGFLLDGGDSQRKLESILQTENLSREP
ncbi:MAG: hypothetical protein H8E37_06205 [Planctomycetes bacterium]|nr:hypothetical protein [Planctomycetota bacterium]